MDNGLSKPGDRSDLKIREESPSSTGQGAGQRPGGVTLRKVPQKHTALCIKSKGEMVR